MPGNFCTNISPIAQWRIKAQAYKLAGETCDFCQKTIFPPRDLCPECELPNEKVKGGFSLVEGNVADLNHHPNIERRGG